MARRRWKIPADQKDTLLGMYWNQVERVIYTKAKQDIQMFCPFPMSAAKFVEQTVPVDVRDVLSRAHKYKAYAHDPAEGYTRLTESVNLHVDYRFAARMMVPHRDYIHLAEVLNEIEPWLASVQRIYQKWMLVRHVALYVNQKCTLGAARYYWPYIMPLIPADCPKLRELQAVQVGNNFKDPPDVHLWLHLIRETATTVTGGMLMPPNDDAGSNGGVKLTFEEHDFTHPDVALRVWTVRGMSIGEVKF